MSSRRKIGPEEACRAKIRELLQKSMISSMEDIQNLFKETIAKFIEKRSLHGTGRGAGLW